MIDPTFVEVILGFIGLLFTILWSERRQDKRISAVERTLAGVQVELAELKAAVQANSERLDRMNERFDRQDRRFDGIDERFDRQAQRFDGRFDEMQQSIRIISSKVDRAQGNLDVLVFGDRGVPEPVARERAALEGRIEEAVGD